MVDGGSSSIEDADRSDVVRSLMGNPWPPMCPRWIRTDMGGKETTQTNCIGGTREDKGSGNATRDS